MKKFLLVLVVLGTATALVLPACGRGRDVFRSDLMGSQPGQTIRTVSSGGAPWTMEDGSEARLTEDGRLKADIKGLLITGTGTAADGTTGTIALPPTCLGPIILIRANSASGPWIAATGF